MVPSKKNEDRDARKVEFDREGSRQRHIVERLSGWLKECRCVFVRYDKTAINFCSMIKMAVIERCLKMPAPRVQGQSPVAGCLICRQLRSIRAARCRR